MARNSRLLTAGQSRKVDLKAKKLFGIPVLLLMENAGRQVAQEALKDARACVPVAVFCGKGNNGGDGLAAARHLITCGIRPDVFLAAKISEVRGEAKINLRILLNMGQGITQVNQVNIGRIKREMRKYRLIIDALLGVGLEGEVRGIYKELIGLINASSAHVLSVDIPSGLNATNGEVLGCCVRADKTVTFVARKRGMVLGSGPEYCGKVRVCDLGIPL